MKVKIICPSGYGDRFGAFHAYSTIAELPDGIARKLIQHRIATLVVGRAVKPDKK